MPADDFNLTIDNAACHVFDATCELRLAGVRSLPHPHRRLLNASMRSLERTLDTLYTLRNDPWHSQTPPKPSQLSLL